MKSHGHSRRRPKQTAGLWREMHAAALPGSDSTVSEALLHARSLQLPLHLRPTGSSLCLIALSILEASCRGALPLLVISSPYFNQWSLLPGDSGFDSGLLDRAHDFLTELLLRRQ